MWYDGLLVTSAVLAALAGIIGLLWKVSNLIARGEQLLAKDKEGKTSIDRLNDRLESQTERIDRIDYQLHPNGGGSLSDKVNKVEKDIEGIKSQNETVLTLLQALVGK
jgi:hypothetical protein